MRLFIKVLLIVSHLFRSTTQLSGTDLIFTTKWELIAIHRSAMSTNLFSQQWRRRGSQPATFRSPSRRKIDYRAVLLCWIIVARGEMSTTTEKSVIGSVKWRCVKDIEIYSLLTITGKSLNFCMYIVFYEHQILYVMQKINHWLI